MVIGVLEQDDHVLLGGIVTNAMDKTTPIYFLAFERGKIDGATVLYVHALGTCETIGSKNQYRCAERHGLPLTRRFAAHRVLHS